MQIETIKISAIVDADNPLGYVVINKSDFDGSKHEPFSEDDVASLAGSEASSGRVPTMAELLAARDQLLERERELNAERERLADQAAANVAEAQRLAAERATLSAPGAGATPPDYSTMSKDELHAALNAKGAQFPAAANKAELIALLTTA
jgi:hypothetical protein